MSDSSKSLDKHWHLAQDASEVIFTEFEFSLIRISSAFERWQRDCIACCVDGLSATDSQLLNIVAMHDRAKGISEIARLNNRDDSSNLLYNIRKLQTLDLIEKVNTKSKRGVTYQVTKKGREAINKYVMYRRELLLDLINSVGGIDEKLELATKNLNLISGLYDQASCVAAAHRVG